MRRVMSFGFCVAALATAAGCELEGEVTDEDDLDLIANCARNANHPHCDATAPTIAIATPSSGATLSGTATVSGTAADASGLARVEVKVDAGAFALASGTATWSFALDTTTLAAGPHTITARAVDVAGNVATASVPVDVSATAPPMPDPPSGGAIGAVLPISYDLGALSGTVRYVATTGNDSTGNGSIGAPYATLARAVSAAATNDHIVIRGGTYRGQGGVTVPLSKTLKIHAYPGETPVFNGARAVTGGWVAEGSFSFIPYTPRPVTDGSGVSFTTGQNLTGDGVGKYADQAWIGDVQLRQVSLKSSLVAGTFWVDRANSRLYMTATDASRSGIEVSQVNRFLYVFSPDTLLEGLRITRYSNSAGDYGVIIIAPEADRTLVRHVEIADSAFMAVTVDGSSSRNVGTRMDHVTIARSNWMGISLNATDEWTMTSSLIRDMNPFDEFTHAPMAGAIKTARTWYTSIIGSDIRDNHSAGLWFDISNYAVVVANNRITGNRGAGVFFEISDDLLLINNHIVSSGSAQPVKLAGSSGLKLVNNTIVGGRDPIGVYTDDRSIEGCADPANPPCGEWGGLRDSYHPYLDTMDWIPRLDLMINNVVAYPTASGYCGVTTPLCFTQRNSSAYVSIETTLHHADASRGIPQSDFDANVYANGSGPLVSINEPLGRYTTLGAFSSAMAGGPVFIGGFEAAGRFGNAYVNADGSPTAALSTIHAQSRAVPVDAVMNQFIPAGTRHYGVTYR